MTAIMASVQSLTKRLFDTRGGAYPALDAKPVATSFSMSVKTAS